ncbi:DUF2828 domain-containing protein, partial [Aureispira]|nr:DUF2828 domain-containing protein [Aureispira sp.]
MKRSLNYPRLIYLLKDSCKKDLNQTILIIFYIRDIQGSGEKKLAKEMLQWLMINYPFKFRKILHFIPIFGRWDDLLYFFPNITRLSSLEYVNSNYLSNINEKNLQEIIKTQNKVIKFFCDTLKRDLENMNKAKNITLLAKWAPSEYSSKDNKYNLVETICNYMKISPRIYRKRYLTPLRKYLKIVERSMCAKKWDKIDYDLIPSKARLNLHYAFIRNDNKRYLSHKFIKKQNTPAKYAYQIIYNYAYAIKINPVIEKQWDNFINNINNNFENLRVCVDTTSSMYIRKNNKKYLFNRFF